MFLLNGRYSVGEILYGGSALCGRGEIFLKKMKIL